MIICFGMYVGYSWGDMSNHVVIVDVPFFNAITTIVSINGWHIQHVLLVFTITGYLGFVIPVGVSQITAIECHVVLL